MVEAVMRAQGYAVSMEHDMSRVFGCDRGGMSGKVDSDFIRRNSLAAVLMTFGYIYGLPWKKDDREVHRRNKLLLENELR